MSKSAVKVSSDGYIQTLDPEAAMQKYASDFEAFSKAGANDPRSK